MKIEVCMGTNCMMNGAMQLYDQLQSLNEIIEANPEGYSVDHIEVNATKCHKICKAEEDYKDSLVIIDGERIPNMRGAALVEYVMNKIRL